MSKPLITFLILIDVYDFSAEMASRSLCFCVTQFVVMRRTIQTCLSQTKVFREKFCSADVALMCISAIFSLWPFVKYSSVLFVRSQETSVHCILLRNTVYVALA
jgi:hypothetical protein